MYQDIKDFYNAWKVTAIGKAVKDMFFSVLSSAIVFGGAAVADSILLKNEINPQVLIALFYAGCLTGAAKAVTVFISRYRNPLVPNTPQ